MVVLELQTPKWHQFRPSDLQPWKAGIFGALNAEACHAIITMGTSRKTAHIYVKLESWIDIKRLRLLPRTLKEVIGDRIEDLSLVRERQHQPEHIELKPRRSLWQLFKLAGPRLTDTIFLQPPQSRPLYACVRILPPKFDLWLSLSLLKQIPRSNSHWIFFGHSTSYRCQIFGFQDNLEIWSIIRCQWGRT